MFRDGIWILHWTGYFCQYEIGVELEVLISQMVGFVASMNVPEEYGSIEPSLLAQFEEHQLGVVVQLNAEPVPADLIGGQLFGEPLVVHPGPTRYRLAVYVSRYGEQRKRDIVGGPSLPFGLLADPVLALDHEGLFRLQLQVKSEVLRHGVEGLGFTVPCRLPVSIPDPAFLEAGARHARSRAVEALVIPEPFSLRIRQSSMGQIDVLDGPGGLARLAQDLALAEENQLEAVPFTPRTGHIACVIPPFRAKVLMLEMIAGKLIGIAGSASRYRAGRLPAPEGRRRSEIILLP